MQRLLSIVLRGVLGHRNLPLALALAAVPRATKKSRRSCRLALTAAATAAGRVGVDVVNDFQRVDRRTDAVAIDIDIADHRRIIGRGISPSPATCEFR